LILDSGKYPSNWRKSFIILLHKSGDKLNVNNYRGISLQNCIAKLFSAALNSSCSTLWRQVCNSAVWKLCWYWIIMNIQFWRELTIIDIIYRYVCKKINVITSDIQHSVLIFGLQLI